MERKATKGVLVTAAVLFFLIVAWIYMEGKGAEAVSPPAGATSLAPFLAARPQYSRIYTFVYGGRTYVEVIGEASKWILSFPSGPPVYIFDDRGGLVDWAVDIGDAPSFVRKWGGFRDATAISRKEAIAFAQTNRADGRKP